jgi:hypothetical protein
LGLPFGFGTGLRALALVVALLFVMDGPFLA